MDQNNIYDQNFNNETGVSQPVAEQTQQVPQYAPQYGYGQQPPQYAPQQPQYGYGQPMPAPVTSNPAVEECASSAFGKSLASVIMAWFPITSFIAIFLAGAGMRGASEARDLAARLGISAGGKSVAARIMGIIGLISSIIMTVFYFFYIILIAGLMSSF